MNWSTLVKECEIYCLEHHPVQNILNLTLVYIGLSFLNCRALLLGLARQKAWLSLLKSKLGAILVSKLEPDLNVQEFYNLFLPKYELTCFCHSNSLPPLEM